MRYSSSIVACFCVLGLCGASRSYAALPVDRIWVLSPEWLVLSNDYMDETDHQIYDADKQRFDSLLPEQLALEQGLVEKQKGLESEAEVIRNFRG